MKSQWNIIDKRRRHLLEVFKVLVNGTVKKMAQPAYDKLIKSGEKNLEIVDSDKDEQEVMNMLLGGDENTGSQHAMDALDKIKEVTSPRSYQYCNPKLKQKYSKLLQSKQIKTIEKLIKHVWKLVK